MCEVVQYFHINYAKQLHKSHWLNRFHLSMELWGGGLTMGALFVNGWS